MPTYGILLHLQLHSQLAFNTFSTQHNIILEQNFIASFEMLQEAIGF